MTIAPVMPSLSPSMDIQVASNFERLLFELKGRNGAAVDRRVAAVPRYRRAACRRAGLARGAGAVFGPPRRRRGDPRHDRRYLPPRRIADRSAYRGRGRRRACARSAEADRATPIIALATAHPAKFPDAVERATGIRPALPPALAEIIEKPRTDRPFCRTMSTRSRASSALTRAGRSRRRHIQEVRHDHRARDAAERAAHRHRPHRYRGHGLARAVGRCRHKARGAGDQRRRAFSRTHGVQGHRAAQRPRHRRGDRGGRRPPQRLYLARKHRVLRQGAEGGSAARARHPRRHPAAFDLRSGRARTRAHRDPAGDRAGQRHARRHHLRSFPGARLSRPGDGPAGAGQPGDHPAGCRARRSSPICATITAPPAWCCRPPAISTTTVSSRSPRRCCRRCRRELPVTTEPARYAGGDHREDRDLEQLHLVLGFPGIPLGDPDYYAASVLSTAFGGGMSSRLFQEVREKRGLVYSIHSFAHSYRDGGLFGIYAGTGEEEAAELVPVLCEEAMRLEDGLAPGRAGPRQGADEGGAVDVARKHRGALRADGAAHADPRHAVRSGRHRPAHRGGR